MENNFFSALAEFYPYLSYERRLSTHTVIAYKTDLTQMSTYLKESYDIEFPFSVAAFHLRSWLSDLMGKGLKVSSLKRKIASCNTFFQYLISIGELKSNPARHLLLPKGSQSLPGFLEEKQTDKLASEIVFPDSFEGFTQRLIIELLYQTGMRRAELIYLKENDIDSSRRQIEVLGKGNKIRIIPLNSELMEDLNQYMILKNKILENPPKNLLSLKSGKPLYPKYVYRVVKSYLSSVTTLDKRSPHILRHTFASQLLNRGADLVAIKDLLGHQSLAATQVYTHLNIERLKQVYKDAHPKAK